MDHAKHSPDGLWHNAALPGRFWSKVDADRIGTGCWVWQAYLDEAGYGRIGWNGRSTKAYRLAYMTLIGPIPKGLHIDHMCRNRACCNPHHLEPVTQGENNLRGYGFSGVNARKQECIRGHALEGDNLYLRPDGGRTCRKCMYSSHAAYKARKRAEREPRKPRTHCHKGHPFDEANTRVSPCNGKRYCRTCNIENAREWRRKKAARFKE